MIITETSLQGAYIIDLKRWHDDRGFLARVFCQRQFAAHGLNTAVVQASIASNRRRGTVRGMHFQYPPAAETKLVRCTRGALLDVIVDLRPESPTYLQHVSMELSAANGRSLYVPERFAHGYQTLEDDTDASYHMTDFWTPDSEGGLAHDDPRLAIRWPLPVAVLSERDRRWARLETFEPELRRRMTAPVPTDAQ
jgi:dTDP-4-dehydrorhamnose 3,5-epimerase